MRGALIVLDGWGLGDHDGRDAVRAAETPTFDRLRQTGAFGTLRTHGRRVGLPEGQMGNSEVGHLNIGAGRVVRQAYTRIVDSIDDGSFRDNDALNDALSYADDHDGAVHLMGLVSDGGVHSDISHFQALIELAADRGVDAVTHAFTDGRDTAPKSGAGHLETITETAADHGTGDVATVSGRYYAMDRDVNWERTNRAYDAIVNREADHEADTAVAAVEDSYARDDTDEFIEPTLVADQPALADGDAIIFVNFRADRARQLVRMLADIEPEWGVETSPPDTKLVTMTQYDKTFDLDVAYPPEQPANTLGEVVADASLDQLRLAESEKYPHVTYFLNGGREIEFDGERREIIKSPAVATYDLQPEMHAETVTDTAIDIIEADDPELLVVNYANPDMVGHTGDYEAAISAVETVDEQLGRLAETIQAAGGHLIVTADHGNADDMGTEADPHTAHTFNPAPVIYISPDGDDGGQTMRDGGALCDLAPTLLELMELPTPEEMTGDPLLEDA
ncbi:2,3-bisphosphoglycerate-independent phosphoglycerate mutase [Halonotius aquaticus]|uniref:2,3-bisphosphoglycerate-independent phosphoglycerate mutase n=1 Tax=Halonotius aquaticus TaxID=2216978 RepID=A0A3A6Q039_9EURY|nr:2,3-bisphosphoglycerate-independent phosphoglycerate mutase [Halonotius aquaticus]RJX42493.1 2,3-bisphosphoglycerate-independent phosphoglycerate mutase [Halonotius aquaticus]